MVVSNIFYFHPYLGKIPICTNIFQRGWFNHQLENMFFFWTHWGRNFWDPMGGWQWQFFPWVKNPRYLTFRRELGASALGVTEGSWSDD